MVCLSPAKTIYCDYPWEDHTHTGMCFILFVSTSLFQLHDLHYWGSPSQAAKALVPSVSSIHGRGMVGSVSGWKRSSVSMLVPHFHAYGKILILSKVRTLEGRACGKRACHYDTARDHDGD